jgi:hypothetical protein
VRCAVSQSSHRARWLLIGIKRVMPSLGWTNLVLRHKPPSFGKLVLELASLKVLILETRFVPLKLFLHTPASFIVSNPH